LTDRAFDPFGNLFVSDYGGDEVLEYKNGNLATTPVTISKDIDGGYHLALYNPK
jgi:hypothetical protein